MCHNAKNCVGRGDEEGHGDEGDSSSDRVGVEEAGDDLMPTPMIRKRKSKRSATDATVD